MGTDETNVGIPRWVEAAVALVGLVLAAPLILLSAVLVSLTSTGPVIFRQKRVGVGGELFTLYKFRTMRVQNAGLQVTAGDDKRITWFGRFLRKTKLDELPELWNVITGDMSLVGPRPEVPHYVDWDNEMWREVLRARPGITDPVTLKLRNEEELLASVQGDRDSFYKDCLLPYKLIGYRRYIQRRTFRSDLIVLWKTAVSVLIPSSAPPPTLNDVVSASTNRLPKSNLPGHK
jgi:lipopolysaccharide/colanic/teichoic acid biosynthesis glycosyltransferase